MATILRIGLGRSQSGKILDRGTIWLNLNTKEEWKKAVNEWSNKRYSGKPIFISRNGRAYEEIKPAQLLEMGDKLK